MFLFSILCSLCLGARARVEDSKSPDRRTRAEEGGEGKAKQDSSGMADDDDNDDDVDADLYSSATSL